MLTSEEETVLAAISLAQPWALVERFATMPRWMPEDVNRAADELIGRLADLGLAVTVHAPEIFLSVPLSASVSAGGRVMRAKPPSMSLSAPDGVTAPLVHLGARAEAMRSYSGNAAELLAEGWEDAAGGLAGRILLTEGFGNPGMAAVAERLGAVGLICINPGEAIHWGTCTTIWGTPGLDDLSRKPGIPVLAVNATDGQALVAMARGGAEVTIRTEMLEGWFAQKIPVVQIDGTETPEDFVLLHGHYDSWDVGVGDNATGDACMLEVARVLHLHRDRLRRSVRIAWWPGHSTGRYAGSTWYADEFGPEIEAHCVASVNCDSPGCRWATSYHRTTCMAELKAHVSGVIEDVAGQAPDWIRPKRAGDHSFYNIGLPTYFSLTSTMPEALRAEKGYYEVSGCGGNIAWHTEDDTLEIADRDVLLTDIRIYTLAMLRHAGAPLLPMDWRATLAEFADTLAGYRAAAGALFDLSPAIAATRDLAGDVDALHDAIAAGALHPRRANKLMTRLGRVLVPVNFATGPRFAQDPAVACPPLPWLALAGGLAALPADRLPFALTELRRGLNRYLAAMAEAERLIEEALA